MGLFTKAIKAIGRRWPRGDRPAAQERLSDAPGSLGRNDCASVLQTAADEEKATDVKLKALAGSAVNAS